MENGEIVGLHPKVVVMMIGTNNIGHGSSNPQQTADGVHAIVERLLATLPGTKVLLLGIFPRGQFPTDKMRQDVATATTLFQGLADGKRVYFLDIGYAFLRSDGELRTTLMPDMLHLTSDGYEIWAKAMKPDLMRLLGNAGGK
jgi:beta-glucosidase